MENYKVYMHIFPNNKVYIGITGQKKVTKRWNSGYGYKNNKYMTNAIMKYGWNNIKHKVLYENLSKEQAELVEIDLIKKYKSNNKKYGYNILSGGNVSNGCTKQVIEKMRKTQKKLWENQEYREHMIKVHTGKKASDETKRKMSESNAKYWLGKHLTEETKEKLSNSRKGRKAWNKGTKGVMKANKTSFKKGNVVEKNCKKVRCIENNRTYNSLHEASRDLNINVNCIMYVCKGKQKTAGNLHWEYV